jgi:DNA-binding NtrC family response regulator
MRNLLLLDKGSSYVRTYKKSLKDKGWRITSVRKIKEALHHLKPGRTDIIIIDASVSDAFSGSAAFHNLSAPIPKIVLLDRDSTKKEKKAWLKCDLAFPIREEVTSEECIQWVKKLALYTSLKKEHETIKTELGKSINVT